jgi:hypothetical protein
MSAPLSLEPNDSLETLRRRVAAFVEENIMPLEADRANYDEHENRHRQLGAGLGGEGQDG